jgi:hypothetical protein
MNRETQIFLARKLQEAKKIVYINVKWLNVINFIFSVIIIIWIINIVVICILTI